jgi:type IV secretory pathway VirB4 component
MLRLDKVTKPWKESAALNDHINLYGFWNETAFLTKSGDVGMILSIPGVDYESLDRSEQEYAVKRLEAALKAFGPGFHVYQYLFKSNRPDIPFATYDDPIVQAAIDQRRKFFEAKRDHLYQVEIFYCILLEGARSKTGVGAAIARILRDPAGAVGELKVQFTNDSMKTLLRTHVEHDLRRLDQSVQAFARQLADVMQIEVLNQQGQFTFFRRLLNYDDWRVEGRPQSTQFLDYQVVNSDIEAERDHLRVGDHIVRVLTMKEAITETRPLVLDVLLKIPANFYVVTEWTPLPADKARKEVNKRRRHFNISKTGFVSQMGNDATKTNPRDVLVDESKQADIENLGDCLRALGDGQSLGDFSLTIVLYGRSQIDLEQLGAEFTGLFTNADGNLFAETYNQLNAYFATVPGNYALNLRKLYLLNTNYADLSFLVTILPGEKTNAHLGTECLAVLETDNSTPYYLNLHTGDVAHTLILGMSGSGKTTLLRILADFIPEQDRLVVIEDTSELQIQKPNILPTECQTDTFKAKITFDDLLKSALRWRPDRIILGEVRGIEARTLLDSFNTGHAGSMATIHANSAEKALHRFANLVMRSHAQSTFADTEAEIAEAVDFVVHVERQPGRRVVREVLALRGYDRDAKRFLIDPVFEVQHATASARSTAPIAADLPTDSGRNDCLIPLPIEENPHATA